MNDEELVTAFNVRKKLSNSVRIVLPIECRMNYSIEIRRSVELSSARLSPTFYDFILEDMRRDP